MCVWGTQGGHPLPQRRSSKCMAPQAREISAGPLYRLGVGTEIHTSLVRKASLTLFLGFFLPVLDFSGYPGLGLSGFWERPCPDS